MSEQDRHFPYNFSVVIGSLVTIAIVLFGIARGIGTPFEAARADADSSTRAKAAKNMAPAALTVPKNGAETIQAVRGACHATGAAGAPKLGDHAAWGPRIGQGRATLHEHALKGFTGRTGVMLAKGGRSDLADELVRATVDYMVTQIQ